MSAKKKQFKQTRRIRRHYTTRSRIARYGFRNFARNMWLTVAATAVMTITLLVIFITAVASQIMPSTIQQIRDKVDISVYFKSETSDDVLRNLAGKMRLANNVKDVTISNGQQEYHNMVEQYKNDADMLESFSLVEGGIKLPAVMRVKVNDINNLDSIKNLVETDKLFGEWLDTRKPPTYAVGDKQNQIDKISNALNFAQLAGVVIGSIFLLISFLIIFNTIRMAIFSRREEIDMMKSIGADKHFIRGPFLIEAEMYGVFAALIAVTLGYVGFMSIIPALESADFVVAPARALLTDWWWVVMLGMVAVGMMIGYVSAWLAVRRYLKA